MVTTTLALLAVLSGPAGAPRGSVSDPVSVPGDVPESVPTGAPFVISTYRRTRHVIHRRSSLPDVKGMVPRPTSNRTHRRKRVGDPDGFGSVQPRAKGGSNPERKRRG